MAVGVHSSLAFIQGSREGLSKFQRSHGPPSIRLLSPPRAIACLCDYLLHSSFRVFGFHADRPAQPRLNDVERWTPGSRWVLKLVVDLICSPWCIVFAFRCGVFRWKVLNVVPRLLSVAEVDEYHATGITPNPVVFCGDGTHWRIEVLN